MPLYTDNKRWEDLKKKSKKKQPSKQIKFYAMCKNLRFITTEGKDLDYWEVFYRYKYQTREDLEKIKAGKTNIIAIYEGF